MPTLQITANYRVTMTQHFNAEPSTAVGLSSRIDGMADKIERHINNWNADCNHSLIVENVETTVDMDDCANGETAAQLEDLKAADEAAMEAQRRAEDQEAMNAWNRERA